MPPLPTLPLGATAPTPQSPTTSLLPPDRFDRLLADLQQSSDIAARRAPGDKQLQDAVFLVAVGVQLEFLVREVFGPQADARLVTFFDSRCGVPRPDLALVVNNTQPQQVQL